MIRWSRRPGAGFIVFVATALIGAGFLAWGVSRPPLDEAWATLIELEIGREIAPSSVVRLRAALLRHPGLAENAVDGARYGLVGAEEDGLANGRLVIAIRRGPDPPLRLVVQPAGAAGGTLRVVAKAGGKRHEAPASSQSPFTWDLPDEGPFPQMTEIELDVASDNGVRASTLLRLEEVSR